jgi:hypothetical protein
MTDVVERVELPRANRTRTRARRRKKNGVAETTTPQVQQQQAADATPESFDRQRNADYWRARAQEVRRIAAAMADGKAKETILDIAEKYDLMAKLAAERRARAPKKS